MTELTPLQSIRPGDKVILQHTSSYTLDKVATVDRAIKTQIIIGNLRFRISDGRQLASEDRWSYYWIIPATPDEIAEVERQQQLKQDQRRVYQLAKQVGIAARNSSNAAAAIPHLEAALAALNQNESP